MRSSRWRTLIKIVVFIILFLLIQQAFTFVLEPENVYARLMMHGMYEQESIDIVFLGASHAYRSFVPSVFDEKTGMNTYNVGTSSQTLKDSYYLLKEVFKTHDPKQVVLESGYSRFATTDYNGMKA